MLHNLIYIIQRNTYKRIYLKNYFNKLLFYKFHLSILVIKLNVILVLFCCFKL